MNHDATKKISTLLVFLTVPFFNQVEGQFTGLLYEEVQVTHCTTLDCDVTLEQWYSAVFNQAYWQLNVTCYGHNGIEKGSWEGEGVYSGTLCGG